METFYYYEFNNRPLHLQKLQLNVFANTIYCRYNRMGIKYVYIENNDQFLHKNDKGEEDNFRYFNKMQCLRLKPKEELPGSVGDKH